MVIESVGPRFPGTKHDLAYACFLPPGLVSLISAVSTVIPMSSGTAGGIGFLVLIPLSLAALVSIPAGIYLSIVLRNDIFLPLLSILTILRLVEIVTEAGSVWFYNATGWVYGIVLMIVEASWFLVRRWRVPAS